MTTSKPADSLNKHLYEFAFNTFSEAILLLKEDMRIVFVNQAACDYLGYSQDALEEMLISAIDPDIAQEEWHMMWDVKRKLKQTHTSSCEIDAFSL